MLLTVFLTAVAVQIPKHFAGLHMMSVNNQICIPVYHITGGIHKQTAVFIIFLIKIVIQIILVIGCLHYRIVYNGIVNFQPSD